MEDKKNNKRKWLLIILLLLLISGFFTGYLLNHPVLHKSDIDGEEITLKEPEIKNGIVMTRIPGYANEILNAENRELRLMNPECNQVLFQYEIVINDQVIYATKQIPPNRMVRADLYELLDAGDYDATLHISTFDVKTKEPCNGANLHLKLQVIK